MTVNDPWILAIPSKVLDAIEQTAEMTGQAPAVVVSQMLVAQFEAGTLKKKLSSAANPAADCGGPDPGRNVATNRPSPQQMLPLCE